MVDTVSDLIKVLQQDRVDKAANEKRLEQKEKTNEIKRINDERKADRKFKSDQDKLAAQEKKIENEAKLLRRQTFDDRKEAKAAYEKLEAERKQLAEDKQQLKNDKEVVLAAISNELNDEVLKYASKELQLDTDILELIGNQ